MKRTLAVAILALLLTVPVRGELERALVEVVVTYQDHDAFLPWRNREHGQRTGFAVSIGSGRLVTTETLLRNHRLVELRQARAGEKMAVDVELADSQLNLAILRIPGDAAVAEIPGLELATDVPTGAELEVAHFDETAQLQVGGGHLLTVSTAKLPKAPYQSLMYSVACDINIDGEGAPVLYGGKLAGISLSYSHASRTANVVALPVLRGFIDDVLNPPYEGTASAGFIWKPLIDPVKRRYLGAPPDQRGVMVAACLPGTGSCDALEPGDVLLEWDGHAVDDLGYYDDADLGRLNFTYLIKGRRRPGAVVPVRFIRRGEEMDASLVLGTWADSMAFIPENVTEQRPEHLIEGGLIFRPLTGHYLRARGGEWERKNDPRLVHLYLTRHEAGNEPGGEVVILAGVLPDAINIGYQHFRDEVVTSANGQPVRNMADLFAVADRDGHVSRIGVQGLAVEIVLDAEALPAANARLEELYRLPQRRYRRGTTAETGG